MNPQHDLSARILVIDQRGNLFNSVKQALDEGGLTHENSAPLFTTERVTDGGEALAHVSNALTEHRPCTCIFWELSAFDENQLLAWSADIWRADRSLPIVACVGDTGVCGDRLANAFTRPDGWYTLKSDPASIELRQLAVSLTMTHNTALSAEVRALRQELEQAMKICSLVEVSNGVLHNVGNVLNSISVSTGLINDRLQKSKVPGLLKATELMRDNADNLPQFIDSDERGKHLPGYLINIATMIDHEQEAFLQELGVVSRNMEHVKQIISTQQSYARLSGNLEEADIKELLDDAVRINTAGLERHDIELIREYEALPSCLVDRHRVMQILVNLISNAKAALNSSPSPKRITVRLTSTPGQVSRARIEVIDNGIGISKENLARVFEHGFTTRSDGHGFGLHSAINAANEMQGTITAESDGPGQGAKFTLDLPVAYEQPARNSA